MNASFTAAGLAWFDHPHEYHLPWLPDGDRFDDCEVKLTEGITAEIRSSTSNPLYPGLMLILTVPEITFLVTEKQVMRKINSFTDLFGVAVDFGITQN